MSKQELSTWITTTDTEYLKRFTGVKTDKGIARFRASFIRFLSNHAFSDKQALKAVLRAFKKSLRSAP